MSDDPFAALDDNAGEAQANLADKKVAHLSPDFKVTIEKPTVLDLNWSIPPTESKAELLEQYVSAQAQLQAAKEHVKAMEEVLEDMEPAVRGAIAQRREMEIPAAVGYVPYTIRIESRRKLTLEGERAEVLKSLQESPLATLQALVKPDYNWQNVMRHVRKELKDAGVSDYTQELVYEVLPPALGQYVQVVEQEDLVFKRSGRS